MAKKPKSPQSLPAEHGTGAGKGGNVPPPEHRWPPGVSGNPKGRPSTGASLKEWLNVLGHDPAMDESALRAVYADKRAAPLKRAAALRLLRLIEVGDVADFRDLVAGAKTVDQLRGEGVDTSVIKRLKPTEHGLEIELHDRSGEEFDRISDRTDGKPRQSVEVEGSLNVPQAIIMNVVGPRRPAGG